LGSYFKRKEGKSRKTGEKETRGCKGKEETGKEGKVREEKGKENEREKRTVWICSPKKNFLVTLRRKKLCSYKQKSFSFRGTSSPRSPTGALPLDHTGGLSSPDPLTSRPLT